MIVSVAPGIPKRSPQTIKRAQETERSARTPYPRAGKLVSRKPVWRSLLGVVAVVLILGALGAAWQSSQKGFEAQRLADELAGSRNISGQSWDGLKKVFTGTSEIDLLAARGAAARANGWNLFYVFVGLSVLSLAVSQLARLGTRLTLLLGTTSVICSAVCGIVVPALEITAQHKSPVGEIVLFHESRGILATVVQLLGPDGSLVVGLPLLVFSVVLPLAKTFLLLATLVGGARPMARIRTVIEKVGRWSMADVFVVALLLSFFAANHNPHVDASVLPGIGFFAYYAFASLVLAAGVDHVVNRIEPGPEISNRSLS